MALILPIHFTGIERTVDLMLDFLSNPSPISAQKQHISECRGKHTFKKYTHCIQCQKHVVHRGFASHFQSHPVNLYQNTIMNTITSKVALSKWPTIRSTGLINQAVPRTFIFSCTASENEKAKWFLGPSLTKQDLICSEANCQ